MECVNVYVVVRRRKRRRRGRRRRRKVEGVYTGQYCICILMIL